MALGSIDWIQVLVLGPRRAINFSEPQVSHL